MWLVTCDMWHVTRGTWQVTSVRLEEVNLLSKFQVLEVTCDTWHGTPETWHWISDTWHMTCATHKGWWTLYQNCRSLALWGCPVGWTQIHFVLWSSLFIKNFFVQLIAVRRIKRALLAAMTSPQPSECGRQGTLNIVHAQTTAHQQFSGSYDDSWSCH